MYESQGKAIKGKNYHACIKAYESIDDIEAMLPSAFIQCHKSYLVNMEKIVEMRYDGVDLVSGATIPVSQKRSRDTRDAFTNYLFRRS